MLSLIYTSFQLLKTAELFILHSATLSHDVMGDCTAAEMGRKLGTEVGVNSYFVALILLPEVSVNRHGQNKMEAMLPEPCKATTARFCPKMASGAISEHLISKNLWGSMPPRPP